jgi:hypothetical protein
MKLRQAKKILQNYQRHGPGRTYKAIRRIWHWHRNDEGNRPQVKDKTVWACVGVFAKQSNMELAS